MSTRSRRSQETQQTAYGLPRREPSTNRPSSRAAPSPNRTPPSRSKSKDSGVGQYMTRRKRNALAATLKPPCATKRRSGRGTSSLWDLARFIKQGKQVVFITGAGLSVASGVRAFRTTNNGSKLYSNDASWKNPNPSPEDETGSTNNGTTPTTKGATGKRRKFTQNETNNKATATSKTKSPSETKAGLVEEQPLGIWNAVLWTTAKRETFRKDPLVWWNSFWLRYFPVEEYENKFLPNAGHLTLASLQRAFPSNIRIITQNVDGLQHVALDRQCQEEDEDPEEVTTRLKDNIIEAHGRLGLYKCIPAQDSDTDSSSDEDDDRPVHLGHRRKYRAWKQKHTQSIATTPSPPRTTTATRSRDPPGRRMSSMSTTTTAPIREPQRPRRRSMAPDLCPPTEKRATRSSSCAQDPPGSLTSTDVSSGSSMSDCAGAPSCRYQMIASLTVDQLDPPSVRDVLDPASNQQREQTKDTLTTIPCCPGCGNAVLPQALLFDEGYHSHEHYNFTKMEDWIASADVLVFVGTSFAVTLPLVALDHARDENLPVFNFNVSDMLDSTRRLNAENIMGPSQETLPKLWQAIQYLLVQQAD